MGAKKEKAVEAVEVQEPAPEEVLKYSYIRDAFELEGSDWKSYKKLFLKASPNGRDLWVRKFWEKLNEYDVHSNIIVENEMYQYIRETIESDIENYLGVEDVFTNWDENTISSPFVDNRAFNRTRLSLAIAVAILVILSMKPDKGVKANVRLIYARCFETICRGTDSVIEEALIDDKNLVPYPDEIPDDCLSAMNIPKMKLLVKVVYYALLFETKRIKPKHKNKLIKWLKKEISGFDYETRYVFEFKKMLADNSGILQKRTTVDRLLGLPEERFNLKIGNKRAVKKITLSAYTASSILNPEVVAGDRTKDAAVVSKNIRIAIENGTRFYLIITDPESAAAIEAIENNKLGNPDYKDEASEFKRTYDTIKEKLGDENHYLSRNNVIIRKTKVALPYAMMHVEYIDEYEEMNYIRLDLYSPYFKGPTNTNTNRRSIIVSREYLPEDYKFFTEQLNNIFAEAEVIRK